MPRFSTYDGQKILEQATRKTGASPKQMIKSLVIISEREPLLVIVDGEPRVDMKKLEKPFGKCRFAKPEEVKELTEYEVKGIPLRTVVDPRVLKNDYVIDGGSAVDKLLKIRAQKIVKYQKAEVKGLILRDLPSSHPIPWDRKGATRLKVFQSAHDPTEEIPPKGFSVQQKPL